MLTDENLNDCSEEIISDLVKENTRKRKEQCWLILLDILLVVAILVLLWTNISSHKEIISLEKQLEQEEYSEHFINKSDTLTAMIVAFATQESRFIETAKSFDGKYQGCLQIGTILVDDVNRILDTNKYSYKDRLSIDKSIEMFKIMNDYYNPSLDIDKAVNIWNRYCPTSYRNNVKRVYDNTLFAINEIKRNSN